MKQKIRNSIFLVLICLTYSCKDTGVKSYFEQITTHKSIANYVDAINLGLAAIKKSENKAFLIKSDSDLLSYKHQLGEQEDFYEATYLFDDQGCFEVGLDINTYNKEELDKMIEKLKNYFGNTALFTFTSLDNNLMRWRKKDGKLTAELDLSTVKAGKLILTIFA